MDKPQAGMSEPPRSMFPSGERERELYRLAVETALGGLWDWEVDSGRVRFSRSWVEMLGESRVEPSYRSWESRLHPDDRDRALTALNRHLEGKTEIYACEYRLRTAGGGWKWVYARGRVVQRDEAGKPLRVTGTTMDIDRWKRTEQEARTHREQYRRLLESSADLLFSLDRHGVVRSAGGRRLRDLGHAPERLVGRPLSLLFPEHHGFFLDRSRRVLESGSPITCTHTYLRYGERRTDQSTLYPVTGADGRVEQVGVICRDITGELRTREELQKREEWLQALYDSSPDPIAVIDEEGIFIDCNQAAVRMFVCESPDQLTGGSLLDSVIPGERERAGRSIREVLAHGSVRDIQHTMLRKDGSCFPAEISAGLVSRRSPATIVVTLKDITERRIAEEKLKRERDLISRIAETSPAGIVMADRREKIVFANDQAEKVLGLSRREIARRSYNDPVWRITDYQGNPFSRDALPFTRVARERRAVYDVRHAIQWPDGRRTLLSVNAAPLFDERGGFDGMVATVEDVTERVLAEQTLRRLSAAIEQVEETIIITDLEGYIQYVNSAGVRSSGYTREELIGSRADMLGSGDTDPDVLESLWSTIRSGRTWTGEWINRRKDGGTYREQVTVSPVRDESGRMVGFVSAQRDLTHEQELEHQLLHAQKMESVGRLAGGIAHDFNNLLTVISGNAELLHMALPGSSDLAPEVEEIISTTGRAAALTRQLLAFSRKQVMKPRVLDINKVLRDMGTLLRRLIGEDIELSILLSQPLPTVKIDPGQLEQVMTNLAVNARDAMPEGGTLTVGTSAAAVPEEEPRSPASGSYVPPGSYVLITVSDTGTGMDPDTASRVFEPFFTTKERGKGTGLGLSTCYGIVKQHGGYIRIQSARGEGTTVYLYLPAVEAPAEGLPEQESGGGPAGKGETVLLVEDDAGVRSMVGRCLASRGYRVLEAAHGAEGLGLVAGREREVDLLITDLIMPQMGGRELTERLRRAHPGLKVLLMSGYVEPSAVDLESPDEGVWFLPKPFTPSTLYERIREVLDG